MNQFLLQKGNSEELRAFAHIIEFAIKKNNSIQLKSLQEDSNNSLRIFYVLEGKFQWIINEANYDLYPGDMVVIQPGDHFNSKRGVVDYGTLCWLCIEVGKSNASASMFGKWSSLPAHEILAIEKILRSCRSPVLSRIKDAERVFTCLKNELHNKQIGYSTRSNQLIDELFILIARKLTVQDNTHRDFPQTFLKLENSLRQNLSHQWTVEEMAALVGLCTTTFTEKAKSYSGFSPLNYLISIRISEAIKLLKQGSLSVTDIAFDTGFYSSQHFSTTFKKLTGLTPSEFRKKNILNEQSLFR